MLIVEPPCGEHASTPRRVEVNDQLGGVVAELLLQRWSPQQMSGPPRPRFAGERSMGLGHESIYKVVYHPIWRFLRSPRWAPPRRSPLRTGRDHRREQRRQQ